MARKRKKKASELGRERFLRSHPHSAQFPRVIFSRSLSYFSLSPLSESLEQANSFLTGAFPPSYRGI